MENRTTFDLRIAAHQRDTARINATEWQRRGGPTLLAKLRAAVTSLRIRRPARTVLAAPPLRDLPANRPL